MKNANPYIMCIKLIRFLLYSYKQILIDFFDFKIKLIEGDIYGGT